MEDQIGPTLDQTLGLARRSQVRSDQLNLRDSASRLPRSNHVGQGQPFDGAASDVPIRDQPSSQLSADHAGRAQDQHVHRYSQLSLAGDGKQDAVTCARVDAVMGLCGELQRQRSANRDRQDAVSSCCG